MHRPTRGIASLTLATLRSRPAPASLLSRPDVIGGILTPEATEAVTPAPSPSLAVHLTASGSADWTPFAAPDWTSGTVAVGRWHRPTTTSSSANDGDARMSLPRSQWGTESAERFGVELAPEPARALPAALADVSPASVRLVLGMGDGTAGHGHDGPGFTRALDDVFPNAAVVGIVAGPTPFINGNPFTLYGPGAATLAQGYVGAALSVPDAGTGVVSVGMEWRGLRPLGPQQVVLRSQGNVVLGLADPNAAKDADEKVPTSVLLKSIGRSHDKSRRLYAGLCTPGSETPFLVTEITAGDPGRGFLALATHLSVVPGTLLQFYDADPAANLLDVTPSVTLNGATVACPHGFTLRDPELGVSLLHAAFAHVAIDVAEPHLRVERSEIA
ncbi:hypothetical protein H9P43_002267 [Blastocladiella emersonii ATCC 22665]|nr:hypothetical protein H9P43_002267 [Blastocladiella emersonii ATCC 22665]